MQISRDFSSTYKYLFVHTFTTGIGPLLFFDIDFPIRLTLDYQEDYWIMRSIIRILGQNPDMKSIIALFKQNPDFYKINWFRNDDYKIAQNNKNL